MSINPLLSRDFESVHNYMRNELSSYVVRNIDGDENVHKVIVNNPYFLIENSWHINFFRTISNFKSYLENPTFNRKIIYFPFKSELINLELKFFVYRKIFQDEWTMNTLFVGKANNIQLFNRFVNEKYPNLNSLTDLNIDKANREWLFWLEKNGVSTTYISKRDGYKVKSPRTKYLINLLTEFNKLIDFRDEWEKDIWEAENLNKEYDLFNNERGFDILFENTDPELVKIEIDCYWATCAGLDPTSIIKKYGDRIVSLHIKDLKHVNGEKRSIEIGSG